MTLKDSALVIDIAKSWTKIDPNEKTSSYVKELIQHSESSIDHAVDKLESLFPIDGSRIGFGTAGLRSAMKPGPLGMNDLVIIQAAQGLAKYCLKVLAASETQSQTTASCSSEKPVAVVGYDHRSNEELDLSSKSFALLTKLVFLEAGFDCILLDGLVPTPLVAYSTIKLNAAVGIMVTASHNPKDDAGTYTFYENEFAFSLHLF